MGQYKVYGLNFFWWRMATGRSNIAPEVSTHHALLQRNCLDYCFFNTRTAKGGLLGAPPAMIFDIFQVLWDKCMGFFRIPRGMPTVTSGIKNLIEFIGVVAIWRPKPEVEIWVFWKKYSCIHCIQKLNNKWSWLHWNRKTNDLNHFRLDNDIADIARRRPTSNIQNGGRQTGTRNNFWLGQDSNAISAATPIFSTMPDTNMTLPTLSDIVRHRKLKCRPRNRK